MEWVTVCSVSEIPGGQKKMVQVGKEMICVGNNGNDYFAVQEMCPHRAGPLSEGDLIGGVLYCPWHDAHFEVPSGKCFGGPVEKDLKTYPIRLEGDKVQVQVG